MVKTVYKYFCFFYLFTFIFTSCVASKNIVKNGSLCGVVVDENNQPVPDFLVYCFKNGLNKQSAVTNGSGIFVFPDVEIGRYFIEGEKTNYVKFEKKEYDFYDCSSFICIQIMSLNECIEKINTFIKVNEFQKGVNLLQKISVKEDDLAKAVILSYSAYLNYKQGNMDIYKKNINMLKKLKNDKCNLFIKTMENCIYE